MRRGGRVAKCEFCRKRDHTALCDFDLGQGITCDRKICAKCADHVPDTDIDFCPEHTRDEERSNGRN